MKKKRTTKQAYSDQKCGAGIRGLQMMSYDEWLLVWTESGKLSQRGRGKGMYCMCRIGDTGDYTPDNVFIGLFEDNVSDAAIAQERGKNLTEIRDDVKWKQTRMQPEFRAKVSETLSRTKQGNTNVRGRVWITEIESKKAFMVYKDDIRLVDEKYKRGRK